MEKITIELPIVKVNVRDNYLSTEYAREHYTDGLFLVDDGIGQTLVVYDGVGCIWSMPCPVRLVKDGIEQESAKREREKCAEVLENMNNRLSQIARLVGETKDEVVKSETRIMDELSIQRDAEAHEFTLVMEGMKGLHDAMPKGVGGEGVNILDVAKSFAVIQKPELIKELGK